MIYNPRGILDHRKCDISAKDYSAKWLYDHTKSYATEKIDGDLCAKPYLQHKEKFDLVSYYRLGSSNPDVMQEIYFRLKDGEESWDGLARQFPGATADTTALQGPTPVAEIEATIVEALRQSEKGRIIRPLQVGSEMVVVALEEFQPSLFGEKCVLHTKTSI